MATRTGYFNSVNGDRVYNADDMSSYFSGIFTRGILQNYKNSFKVKANDTMGVIVQSGKAFFSDGKYIENTADEVLKIEPADAILDRIDLVVLSKDTTNGKRTAEIKIKTGKASGSPSGQELLNDEFHEELCLAIIYVDAQTNAISESQINDTRLNDELCGIVESNLADILNAPLYADGAGTHNSIYRGKSLGTSVSKKQWENISNGTFKELYIGDYWEINNTKYRIAAFDYYLNKGDTPMTEHHAVIVPDTVSGTGAMNSTHTTTGAYIGSQMYKTGLTSAKNKIKADFGSSHILTHRNIFNNAVENGHSSASAWYDSQIELMTPNNVYGSSLFTPVSGGQTIMDNSRLDYLIFPLFLFNPTLTVADNSYWLRDVALVEQFCYVTNRGTVGASRAGNSYGIRPSFCIG